jgi:hypothetical protein
MRSASSALHALSIDATERQNGRFTGENVLFQRENRFASL